MQLTHAHREWASRPDDERFLNLLDLADFKHQLRTGSSEMILDVNGMHADPHEDGGVSITYDGQVASRMDPTHWAFGQVSSLAGAPAKYLRNLPSDLIATNLNHGFNTSVHGNFKALGSTLDGVWGKLRAANGPDYGRVWDADLAQALVDRFGDGRTGRWKVPGEFGKQVNITRENTTLFAGDRDMFVFLADEENRISVPSRRENRLTGSTGEMARGFFVWNSEVGSKSLGAAFFLFDYVCCNRIVWGAEQFQEVRIRHTQGAPDRWLSEVEPVLIEYSQAATEDVDAIIRSARLKSLKDKADDLLRTHFAKGVVAQINQAHIEDEDRPIETLWDAVVGVTAYARSIPNQDRRVEVERVAGDLLRLAS